MKNLELVIKEEGTQVWLNFRSRDGGGAMLCINNIANDQTGVTGPAMQKAIAEHLKQAREEGK